MTFNYDRVGTLRKAEGDEEDLKFGELQIADYVVFLLAFDTYLRWMKETGRPHGDPVFSRGMLLLHNVEREHLARIGTFIQAGLTNPGSVRMLENALRLPPTAKGASIRALRIRTILSKGGATTAKHVFGTSTRARREVTDAIESSMVEEAATAFAKFSTITLRDKRLQQWIVRAAASTTSGGEPIQVDVNPVHEAAKQIGESAEELRDAHMVHEVESPASTAHAEASKTQAAVLQTVETKATEVAAQALVQSGRPDVPPTRSETIGIATAAATSAVAIQALQNVPPSLRPIADDPEKMKAVMTDGRVILAAGAGSGKTTALCSRIAYLVQERHVPPSRIFAVVFNTKAAAEISERLAMLVGDDVKSQMTQGTMHSIFRRFIMQYGTKEQQGALTRWFQGGGDRGKSKGAEEAPARAPSPGSMAGYMARCWKECFRNDPPSGSAVVIQKWMMNDISPEQAKHDAIGLDEEKQAEWYEWTLGYKNIIPNWQPPCVATNDDANKHWMGWLNKLRGMGPKDRLGDFSDMILMFRDVLRDNPGARKEIQARYDHICVDEAQDLNQVQHQIIDMISEQVTDGKDGKSLWVVGDEIQSVNAFVGARPELFTQFHGKTDAKSGAEWQTRIISTNYRCLPEIVDVANKLMTTHPRGIPMEAKPDPRKPRGQASVVVERPADHASGALGSVEKISQGIEAGEKPSDYAVLTRTNKELNDFETSCVLLGVPYGRKGGTSFLKSPETQTVLSYMNLVSGTDFSKMQDALAIALNKPQRFFGWGGGEAERVIKSAVDAKARQMGVSCTNVNPLDLFDAAGINEIIKAAGIYEGWKVTKQRQILQDLGDQLHGIKDAIEQGTKTDELGATRKYTTSDVLNDILAITGMAERGKPPTRLRDDLMPTWMAQDAEEDAPKEEGEEDKKPIGNVEFLFHMAQPTTMRKDVDPSDPKQFKAYLDKLEEHAKELRVDLKAWDEEQKASQTDPSKRLPPPCVTLSTVHSMKGAQYKNVVVVMPKGTFPMPPRKLKGEEMLTPEKAEILEQRREKDFLTERQLAYVALTRAKEDLTVLCPKHDRNGRPSEPSIFVEEAGLHLGENVAGKATPEPAPEPIVKMAGWVPGLSVIALFQPTPSGDDPGEDLSTGTYDRRPS
jgi:superfamily I DNA/RNA helicase